ncbi:MAG: hypothetical protein CMI95_05840 [Pelagibacteraceae bacterium]|nr:hypothetical protein [Pelagibacteraceae bacterium]|tara:strand:- start:3019 stop:4122 length:1104 start_codon:yes stop_codon:yes gene_type:complete
MKILLLVAGGRGGSDFFQGLLDGHSQVLTLPGYLRINKDFQNMLSLKHPDQISKRFINLYPHYFNSKGFWGRFERHDRLGKKKNKFYVVNKKKFIKIFSQLMSKDKKSKINIIKNLHMAYSITKGDKKCEKKILFIHTHLVSWTKNFVNTIESKDTSIIHIIRHPLASINSPIRTWLNFKNGDSFFPKDLHFQLDLVFNGIFDLMKLKKVYIMQYEKLHWENEYVMREFCKMFKIKYEKCLKSSTKFGLQWWGDQASKRWISGVNKNFKININKYYFFKRDLEFFQFLTSKIIKNYNYNFMFPKKKIYFNFLPMKCELLVWKNSFKHLRWKQILSIPIFYLIRIFSFNKFTMQNKRLPYSVGSKKRG